jgi:hypothetical protein
MKFIIVSTVFLVLMASCGQSQSTKRQIQYEYWVCQAGEHKGAIIFLARMGNVFRGEYIDPDYNPFISIDDPDDETGTEMRISIPVMGTIDGNGKVTGVSAASRSDGSLIGELSGQIADGKFHAIWLPAPTGFGEFREMELQLEKLSSDMTEETNKHPGAFHNILHPEYTLISMFSGEKKSRTVPFFVETTFPASRYGYHIGEFTQREINITAGAKKGEVDFHLQIEESGQFQISVDVRGTARLNENRFRYREKDYVFEVDVYHDFVVIKTISGFLPDDTGLSHRFTADGVYPAKMELNAYVSN